MKAILVIDMPESCFDCPCESEYLCGLARKELFYEADRKPEWCPLKEMPNKRGKLFLTDRSQKDTELIFKAAYTNSYTDGWNACIEEIEK